MITVAFMVHNDPDNILWCEPMDDGTYQVINGAWTLEETNLRCCKEIWRGECSFAFTQYNEAIAWVKAQVAA